MKHIHAHGSTNVRQRLAKNAIYWYMDMYLQNVRKISIDVQIQPIDRSLRGRVTQNSKRNYTIEIDDRLTMDDFITTVMHEMIHVKQYVLNEMSDMPSGSVRWKKRVINPENLDYWEHPWEKEAFRYDEILACAFMVDMDI
jgi:hypothetical protein